MAGGIAMAQAKAITFEEFRKQYETEEACREELFRLRFPDGFVCPRCGCREYYPIRKRNTCQCKSCRRQTSVTTGTVMHRTHLPLTNWFWAMYLCATDKRGISASHLQRLLDVCYETAWYLLARIRTAMGQRDANYVLSGLVEMDDCYLGGPCSGGKRGRGTDKAKVVVALSKTEQGVPLFTHMQVVEDLETKTLQEFVNQHLAGGSTVQCDGFSSYKGLTGVNCDAKPFNPNNGDLKWLHKSISNLKAFLLGTYHGRCTKLQSYLDEFCFRLNRRHHVHQLFPRLVRTVATSISCALLS